MTGPVRQDRRLTFIDLRKEIEILRDRVGFRWVALRALDLTLPCDECSKKVPDQYDQPSGSCTKCMGLGFLYVDKLVKAFNMLSSPGFDFLSEAGLLNTKTKIFVVEHDKKPKNTDYILLLDIDESTNQPRQPFDIRRVFKIQDATEMIGDGGRTEFWRCHVEERNLSIGKTVAE